MKITGRRLWQLLTVAVTVLMLIPAPDAAGQAAGRDLARAYYESGTDFIRSGRYQQGLADLNVIVESYPQSPYADDALLQIGIHHQTTAANPVAALKYFNTVILRYADTEAAPEAYFRKGQILLDAGASREQLAEASAAFDRVVRFYPDSPAVCRALVHSALALKRMGEPKAALSRLVLLLMETGYPLEALKRLQSLRDRHPDSAEAGQAMEALALLYRMEIRSREDATALYIPDPSFSLSPPEKWKNLRSLRMLTDGRLAVSDRGRDAVYLFDRTGRLVETKQAKAVDRITVCPGGQVLVGAGQRALLLNGGRVSFQTPKSDKDRHLTGVVEGWSAGPWALASAGNSSRDHEERKKDKKDKDDEDEDDEDDDEDGLVPLEEISTAVLTGTGIFLVIDGDRDRVEIFLPPAASGSAAAAFSGTAIRNVPKPVSLEVDRENRIFLISAKEKAVIVFDRNGRELKRLGGRKADLFQQPLDMAIDAAGNLFVLDGKAKKVSVFSRTLEPLFTIPLDSGSMGIEIKKVISLTVGHDGSLYLLDAGARAVHRLN